MKYWQDHSRGVVVVSMHHGDDVLACVERVAREADLQDAVVLTGLGALSRGRIHVIASNNYPPGDRFIELEGPLEITQIGGVIGGGQPHLHMTMFDGQDKSWGGHLEPGCTVLTLCEMTIQRLESVPMTHRTLDDSGVKVLDPA